MTYIYVIRTKGQFSENVPRTRGKSLKNRATAKRLNETAIFNARQAMQPLQQVK